MRNHTTRWLLALTLIVTLMPACIGPFNASQRLHTWNREIENRWVGEAVYIPFRFVIMVAAVGDLFLFNALEFWNFDNWVDPVAKSRLEALRAADEARAMESGG